MPAGTPPCGASVSSSGGAQGARALACSIMHLTPVAASDVSPLRHVKAPPSVKIMGWSCCGVNACCSCVKVRQRCGGRPDTCATWRSRLGLRCSWAHSCRAGLLSCSRTGRGRSNRRTGTRPPCRCCAADRGTRCCWCCTCVRWAGVEGRG